MDELLLYGIVIGIWFVLQLWVFPKLGIPTCMSGACGVPQQPRKAQTEKGKYEGSVDLLNKKE